MIGNRRVLNLRSDRIFVYLEHLDTCSRRRDRLTEQTGRALLRIGGHASTGMRYEETSLWGDLYEDTNSGIEVFSLNLSNFQPKI